MPEGEHSVTYTETDEYGNTSIISDPLVLIVDTTDPTLELNPPLPVMVIQKGESFVEPGWQCSDDNGCTVSVEGYVDTTQASEYTLIYTATDPAGNTVVKKRIVRVEGSNTGNGGSSCT